MIVTNSRLQNQIEKDVDDQLFRVFSNFYWIYPFQYQEYYRAFEEFKFVQKMMTDNQLKVKRTDNLLIIYNDYVRLKKVLGDYYRTHAFLFK